MMTYTEMVKFWKLCKLNVLDEKNGAVARSRRMSVQPKYLQSCCELYCYTDRQSKRKWKMFSLNWNRFHTYFWSRRHCVTKMRTKKGWRKHVKIYNRLALWKLYTLLTWEWIVVPSLLSVNPLTYSRFIYFDLILCGHVSPALPHQQYFSYARN